MTWKLSPSQFLLLSISEYTIVSLSLALVIAKFFPAVHNQIVSRATRLEHQSLYWGTAVVSNIFTYGLLFGAMRASSITRQIAYLMAVDLEWFVTYIVVIPPIQEGITTFIFFISALIASLKGHQQNVPIP